MGNILYLVHRLPYPPNKGDKVRSYHLLKHLSERHRVFLGTFVDDPEDEGYIEKVRQFCADMHVARLNPRLARLRSLGGLLSNKALTLPYYRDTGLAEWVGRIRRTQAIDAAVIFSSAMAQYMDFNGLPTLVDFVDADSAKWTQYALARSWPLSWLYEREGRNLLAYERAVAARSACSFFVTDMEAELFRRLAPECAASVEAMSNGVDTEYFDPSESHASPYRSDERPIVFTGAMDYWPNVDAVCWFATEVLPKLRREWPQARFWIVGRSPTAAVQALAANDVVVTGTVPDIRPYLMHAATVVAPLRVARGIQNKILEAMAMARPVVASVSCADAVDAERSKDFLAADSVDDFVAAIGAVLGEPDRGRDIGLAARRRVLDCYSWSAHLSGIDRYLANACRSGASS